eukprot:365213-Chlamydomonas_euryale.AAC.7
MAADESTSYTCALFGRPQAAHIAKPGRAQARGASCTGAAFLVEMSFKREAAARAAQPASPISARHTRPDPRHADATVPARALASLRDGRQGRFRPDAEAHCRSEGGPSPSPSTRAANRPAASASAAAAAAASRRRTALRPRRPTPPAAQRPEAACPRA